MRLYHVCQEYDDKYYIQPCDVEQRPTKTGKYRDVSYKVTYDPEDCFPTLEAATLEMNARYLNRIAELNAAIAEVIELIKKGPDLNEIRNMVEELEMNKAEITNK